MKFTLLPTLKITDDAATHTYQANRYTTNLHNYSQAASPPCSLLQLW
jgi:hypothetical protein